MVPPEERGDESVLVERAKGGNHEAFGALVRRHQDRAFAVAYQSLAGFKGEARFSTWLHRIVVNLALDHLRRQPHHEAGEYKDARALEEAAQEVVAPTANPEQAAEAIEMRGLIRQGLAALPAEQRTALVLREIEGLSYKEIARAMRCSIGTVMSRLHYARRKMQTRLRPHR